MKVAMVSEHASPLAVLGGVDAGGQNVHVASLASELAREGCEVTVYTRRDDPDLRRRVRMTSGVVVEHVDAGPPEDVAKDLLLPYMDDFAAALERAWSTRKRRPDVVHSHFWMSGRASLAAAAAFRIPVVHTFHALGIVKRREQGAKDTSPHERLEEEVGILRHADWIISTCSDEVFELKRLEPDADRISVVPCGVDLQLFQPHGPAEQRKRPHRLVVLSRLVERKGIGNVIETLPEFPDAELVIAGGPHPDALFTDTQAKRFRALARKLGVEDRVVLRGRVERQHVPALLRSADAVVCVPWYEPFGIVPLEAMACGVPVVASAVGGMKDTVVHGLTGIHIPPRSPDALVTALREVLNSEELRRSLGAAGARRARARYGWPRVAHATLQVYLSVIADGAARSSQGAFRS